MELPAWEALAETLQAAGHRPSSSSRTSVPGRARANRRRCSCLDPSGNALEFKAFADDSMVFAK
jgi:extradiol dioxygenase family protein